MPNVIESLESQLLQTVFSRRAVSRIDLARVFDLVPSTAGAYVDRLVADLFLLESASTRGGAGRPPIMLELNPAAGRFIGLDFDAREITTTAVNFVQQPLFTKTRTIPAKSNVESVLKLIETSIEEAIASSDSPALAIGIGVPGPVDRQRGISLRYDFIRDWVNVEIGPRIAAKFNLKTAVEHNLRSIALGEYWAGRGHGLRNVVCLGIRSGIGAGIIVEGKLLHGSQNEGGEIGKWLRPNFTTLKSQPIFEHSDRPPTIEEVASMTALLHAASNHLISLRKTPSKNSPSIAELLKAAKKGDAFVLKLLNEAALLHAWTVHQLWIVLDPQRIVISGPLVESPAYLEAFEQAAEKFGGKELSSCVKYSELGDAVGARSAAALAFQNWSPV